MSAVLSNVEVLDPAKPAAVPALSGPNMTVIDNDTGVISYQRKGAGLLLAEAVAVHKDACDLAPLIDSDMMYSEAGELLKKITDSFKTLDEERLSTTKPLRDKVEDINADYKPAVEKRKEAADVLKRGMLTYDAEQERKRKLAEAEARARAEAERRRAEAEARAAREEAEARAAEERRLAEARAAEERRLADERSAAMRREAEEQEAAGNAARADQLRAQEAEMLDAAENTVQTALFAGEQAACAAIAEGNLHAESAAAVAEMITPAAVNIAAPKTAGITKSYRYKANVTDAKAVLQHVLANWDTCNHLVTIEQGKLDNLAQNQKERFNFPGCELVKEAALSSRRK
jgi:hypothetical protein